MTEFAFCHVTDEGDQGALIETADPVSGCPGSGGWKVDPEDGIYRWTRIKWPDARAVVNAAIPSGCVLLELAGDRIESIDSG